MNNVVGSNVPNNLKFKISWVVSLLGALAIVGLTALWAIEMISYGRHFISKIEAFVILLMASALLTYCIIIFKGVKAGKFKSQSVLLFEIGAYCYLAITTILFLSMAIELVLPKVQNWQDALDSMFLPTLMMLFAFSISIFYVIKNRRVIPVSGYEALPQKWSPLWYVALLITLVLFLYGLNGAFAAFVVERGMPLPVKLFIAGALVVGVGYLLYLLNLRVHVVENKLQSRTPIYLEIFAYITIALALFEALRKLPRFLLNFSFHYQWTLGNDPDFVNMVRFLMPLLCISLALISIWLIRVRMRLPKDEYL